MPSKINQMPAKLRLKLANESLDLLSKSKIEPKMNDYKFHLLYSKDVNDITFTKLMTLFETLMRVMYENSNWGWDEEDKLSEWKHQKTRIIIVTERNSKTDTSLWSNEVPQDDQEIVAFMCIRFEIGANKNECSLYVYELHVDSRYQRRGLGEELMRIAKCLALDFKMDKVMLTVFRSNQQALKFYSKLKYSTDKSSPKPNEADYVILSLKAKV